MYANVTGTQEVNCLGECLAHGKQCVHIYQISQRAVRRIKEYWMLNVPLTQCQDKVNIQKLLKYKNPACPPWCSHPPHPTDTASTHLRMVWPQVPSTEKPSIQAVSSCAFRSTPCRGMGQGSAGIKGKRWGLGEIMEINAFLSPKPVLCDALSSLLFLRWSSLSKNLRKNWGVPQRWSTCLTCARPEF